MNKGIPVNSDRTPRSLYRRRIETIQPLALKANPGIVPGLTLNVGGSSSESESEYLTKDEVNQREQDLARQKRIQESRAAIAAFQAQSLNQVAVAV